MIGRWAFLFTGNARLISSEVTERNPAGLVPELISLANGVGINPLLLNKGDWFTVKLWVRDYAPKQQFVFEGRIVDVSSIRQRQVSSRFEEELVTVKSTTISRKEFYLVMVFTMLLILTLGYITVFTIAATRGIPIF